MLISALPYFSQNEKQVPMLLKSSKGLREFALHFSTTAQKEEEEKRTVAMVLKFN